jgi:ubiquinone/menaquinone biosynthesis C-methylase UbiE
MADQGNYFDQSAADWDAVPQRVELAQAVGTAILREASLNNDMDVLDYGCGTGLLGLFLLPHVRSVIGADSSPGMLQVLDEKIRAGGLHRMRAEKLDLENAPIPQARYHLITANMVMHHIRETGTVLKAFREMLLPGGFLVIADLDTEPGTFHGPDAVGVFHHGFDRQDFQAQLQSAGLVNAKIVTAHVVRKPTSQGELSDFSVFLAVSRRAE